MLWFSGERGAMAFALALKSKIDFPNKGKEFLPFTLIFAFLTLIITDLTLNKVINKLGIIIPSPRNLNQVSNEEKQNIEDEVSNRDTKFYCFVRIKNNISYLNTKYLDNLIKREVDETENIQSHTYNEAIMKMSIEHKNLDIKEEADSKIKNKDIEKLDKSLSIEITSPQNKI